MWLSSAVGRFHSLDLNQCAGGLERFLSKELNQGSWDFKSLSLPTKEIRGSKGCVGHIKKKEIYTWKSVKPWKYHGKNHEFLSLRKNWDPCPNHICVKLRNYGCQLAIRRSHSFDSSKFVMTQWKRNLVLIKWQISWISHWEFWNARS